jgi:hypothetical protein
VNSQHSSSPLALFLIHWLQVQVLNDPQQLKAQATRFGLSAFVGCLFAAHVHQFFAAFGFADGSAVVRFLPSPKAATAPDRRARVG